MLLLEILALVVLPSPSLLPLLLPLRWRRRRPRRLLLELLREGAECGGGALLLLL